MTEPTDLVALTPHEAIRAGASSLRMFGRLFFPKTFRQDSPGFHDEIGAALYAPTRFNAFEVFRGGAKTSLLRVFTAQRVGYAVSRTIMYVSVSQAHAVHSIRWLKRAIMYNRAYADTFQLTRGDKWTDELIEIRHGIDDVPITVMAMGITGQIRGFNIDDYRPDLIIADDVLNEENTGTSEQRQKTENLFFGALLNSLAPASEAPMAKAVLLQTPLHQDDIAEKCLRDPQWHGIRYGILDEVGQSRWEIRFPTEQLKKDKESAILRRQYQLWMREMECQIVAGEDTTFDVDRLGFWDILPEDMVIVIAIDPASSDNPDADFNVVIVVGFHGPNIYVLDYYAERGVMPDAVATRFFEFIWRFRPRKAAVESIAYQRVLKWYLEQEMLKRRTFLPIDAVQDRRKKSDRIIQALAGPLHMGCVYVKPGHTDLIDQMRNYNPADDTEHDDILDALAMAVTSINPAARELEGEYENLGYDEDEIELDRYTGRRTQALPMMRGCP
jgi:predicted phage terminase large subunit-like protein